MANTTLYILSGPSGSGKTSAQYVFEENGFFVIENILPNAVIPTLKSLYKSSTSYIKTLLICLPEHAKRIYEKAIEYFEDFDIEVKLIILDCNDENLYKRFRLTRHVHPMTILKNISLTDAINFDRQHVDELTDIADYYFDTSEFELIQLRKTLFNVIDSQNEGDITSIRFISFGHKHGIPMDMDLVLDTRALPNPYWDESLRKYSGLDIEVVNFFKKYPIVDDTINNMIKYLDFYLNEVKKDGRASYTIGIACSGGKHRSVYIAKHLYEHFKKIYNCSIYHRDINKD